MTDFKALRRRFPVLERKTYLNSGSYCALADSVRDAINAYMDDRLQVGANWDVWVTKNEAVRRSMAAVLRAAPGRDRGYRLRVSPDSTPWRARWISPGRATRSW